MEFKFPKNERLKSKKLIEKIFNEGKVVTKFPLKLIFTDAVLNTDTAVQAGFSVPKRNFKKAVQRNRIKRLLREAYRLQKPVLFNNLSTSYAFMFLYLGKDEPDFKALSKTMEQLLIKFQKQTQL